MAGAAPAWHTLAMQRADAEVVVAGLVGAYGANAGGPDAAVGLLEAAVLNRTSAGSDLMAAGWRTDADAHRAGARKITRAGAAVPDGDNSSGVVAQVRVDTEGGVLDPRQYLGVMSQCSLCVGRDRQTLHVAAGDPV